MHSSYFIFTIYFNTLYFSAIWITFKLLGFAFFKKVIFSSLENEFAASDLLRRHCFLHFQLPICATKTWITTTEYIFFLLILQYCSLQITPAWIIQGGNASFCMQHASRSIKQKYKAEANLIFSLRAAAAAIRYFYAGILLRMIPSYISIYIYISYIYIVLSWYGVCLRLAVAELLHSW